MRASEILRGVVIVRGIIYNKLSNRNINIDKLGVDSMGQTLILAKVLSGQHFHNLSECAKVVEGSPSRAGTVEDVPVGVPGLHEDSEEDKIGIQGFLGYDTLQKLHASCDSVNERTPELQPSQYATTPHDVRIALERMEEREKALGGKAAVFEMLLKDAEKHFKKD